jgi:aryl-alcohol dehydrogenase-like predicted oxidoreductase
MQQRTLGSAGLKVGAIGQGCMGFTFLYHERSERDPYAALNRALDVGMNLLDTADMYGPFTNEEFVGQVLRGRRGDAVVATKGGLVVDDVASVSLHPCGRPDYIRQACEGSLRRLGIDHIDIYYLHRHDPNVPIEETLGAFEELRRAGKVGAIGVSELPRDLLERAIAAVQIDILQYEFSLWTREHWDLPNWCLSHGTGLVCYAPLGRGFLTGRFRTVDAFEETDFRRQALPRFQEEALAANLALVDAIEAVARRYEATAAQIALGWILAQGQMIVPIPGGDTVAFVEQNAAAAELVLEQGDVDHLSSLPAPVGERE